MIRFSNRVKYGLQFLLFLSVDNETHTDIQRAALTCEIPYKFLEGIAVDLKKSGILDVKRGAGGGYRLKVAPGQVALADVLLSLGTSETKSIAVGKELTRQVVDEVITCVTDDCLELLKKISLLDIQQKYYDRAGKLMYHI